MATENTQVVLQANQLDTGYSRRRSRSFVSRGIDFELVKGELVALVGPNGIGKSTLLRTLSGMQPALGGSVRINGSDLGSLSPLQLATQLSLVLTQPPASANLSVAELVALGRQPYTNSFGILSSRDRQCVKEALEQTETTALAEKKCFELSDGQLQRVVIARALAQDTGLIIMDEPTTHLDLYHRAYILKLLKKLSAEHAKTILFSTHEIDLAIQIADKMLVMDSKTFAVGQPCKLIESGCFERLFPKDSVQFDPNSGRFTIRN